MNKVVSKEKFSENVTKLVVEAPLIARARRAGHFVIVRSGENGERIPLTIADADPQAGTITLVIQAVGVSTRKLCALEPGDSLTDVVGPLGQATHIEKYGTVLCCGGGVGVAPLLPILRAMKAAGNRVVSVLAGRTKDLIILEDEVRASSDDVIIMTDDGSYGQKGLVTVGVEQVIKREHVDYCVTIGPAVMMKFVALLTKKYNVPTEASLNAIMVDGTGMCGACRVTVGGKTRFVCVEGPEFNAHEVDFDEVVYNNGDSYDRYMLRLKEMEQSIKILRQCCDMMDKEEGNEYCAKVPKLIKLPKGHWYQQVEASRGPIGVYIESDGDPKPFQKPYRLHYQSPCFNLIGVVDLTCKDNLIADLITITASLDYVIPDIDR